MRELVLVFLAKGYDVGSRRQHGQHIPEPLAEELRIAHGNLQGFEPGALGEFDLRFEQRRRPGT